MTDGRLPDVRIRASRRKLPKRSPHRPVQTAEAEMLELLRPSGSRRDRIERGVYLHSRVSAPPAAVGLLGSIRSGRGGGLHAVCLAAGDNGAGYGTAVADRAHRSGRLRRPDGQQTRLAQGSAGARGRGRYPALRPHATRAQAAALYAQSFGLVQWQPERRSEHAGIRGAVGRRLSADGPVVAAGRARTAVAPGPGLRNLRRCRELLDKLAFYRRSPAAALRIAEQGAATYRREHLAEHRIAVLREWMLGGRLPDRFNPRHDLRLAASQAAAGQLGLRIAIYEMLQEQQRVRSGLSVLVPPGWPVASVLDVADLMRIRVTVIEPAPALRAAAAAASVLAGGVHRSRRGDQAGLGHRADDVR